MLRERTKSGLDAARKEGRIGGRRPKLTKQQQNEIVSLVTLGKKQVLMRPGCFKFISPQLLVF